MYSPRPEGRSTAFAQRRMSWTKPTGRSSAYRPARYSASHLRPASTTVGSLRSPSVQDTATVDLGRTLDQYRVELTAYCYRMLGSAEAEDAVQETFIRPWRAYDRFEGRSALKSWLYRIATNVCFDMLNGRERRARPMDLGPAQEPLESNLNTRADATWIEPIPDPGDATVSRETI